MENIIITLISAIASITTCVITTISQKETSKGLMNLMRNEIKKIYYNGRETKQIKEYEFISFCELCDDYLSRKGNTFVRKVYDEVKKWDVIQ